MNFWETILAASIGFVPAGLLLIWFGRRIDRRAATPKMPTTAEAKQPTVPDLDLPDIPASWFFRIEPFDLETSEYTLDVRLMKRDRWGMTTELGSSLSTNEQASVEKAARQALTDAHKAIERRKTIHGRDQFFGDYKKAEGI